MSSPRSGSPFSATGCHHVGVTERFYDADDYTHQDALHDLACGKSVVALMRRTDYPHDRSSLPPGTIISAPVHSQSSYDLVNPDDPNHSLTGFGPVLSKYRKMVVVEVWNEHCICIPMYSYGGKGITNNRSRSASSEYVDIRDINDEDGQELTQTEHPPLLGMRDNDWPCTNAFINKSSILKVTETIPHHFNQRCSIEGRLRDEDVSRLIGLHLQWKIKASQAYLESLKI